MTLFMTAESVVEIASATATAEEAVMLLLPTSEPFTELSSIVASAAIVVLSPSEAFVGVAVGLALAGSEGVVSTEGHIVLLEIS
jgi:hypothetical protein